MKMWQGIVGIILLIVVIIGIMGLIASFSSTSVDGTAYEIGAVVPLTGDGAVYGLPAQRVIEQAVIDLNNKWAPEKKALKVYFDDGKCNPKDGLTAAQNLVNLKGVKVIYGGACSGETLGLAPFANQNKVIALSGLSSSPAVTEAGDYVFRNYPSDTAQVAVGSQHIVGAGYKKAALLSENTDYAQALREGYTTALEKAGLTIVVDEVVDSSSKEVRTQLLKIKNGNPDVVILLPQTIPMAGIFAKQWVETGMDVQVYGNEIFNLGDTIKAYGKEIEGFITPRVKFDDSLPEFKRVASLTQCEMGYYCTTIYDGVFLLGGIFETCGDKDTTCIKEKLYATKGWKGPLGGVYTFDENGDVAGEFELLQIKNGEATVIA